MKKFIFGSLFIILSSMSYAVLPPLYQSINEIERILDDKRLSNELGSGELIREIVRTDDGYILNSTQYSLKIDVVYQPQKIIGPAKFELVFHEKEPFDKAQTN